MSVSSSTFPGIRAEQPGPSNESIHPIREKRSEKSKTFSIYDIMQAEQLKPSTKAKQQN
jgi:hypothetical protein